MRRFLVPLILAALCFVARPAPSTAQVVPLIAAGAVVNKILGDLTEDLDRIIQKAIGQGTQQGNFLLEKSARELRLMVENARTLFAAERDKTFDRLSTEHQRFLSALRRLANEADTLAFRALELKDFLALDLQDRINALTDLEVTIDNGALAALLGSKFKVTTKHHYLVQRIDGYSQIFQPAGEYQFRVIGNAFGPAFVCDATVNGVKVLPEHKATPHAHEFGFSVPASVLNAAFADAQVKRVPFEVVSRQETAGPPVFQYRGAILLLPKYPVRCVVKETRAVPCWSKETSPIASSGAVALGKTADVSVTVPAGCKIAGIVNDPDRRCETVVRSSADELEAAARRDLARQLGWVKKWARWDEEKQRAFPKPGIFDAQSFAYARDYNRLADKLSGHGWSPSFFEFTEEDRTVTRQFTNKLESPVAIPTLTVMYHKPATTLVEVAVPLTNARDGRLPFGTTFVPLSNDYKAHTVEVSWFNGQTALLSPSKEAHGGVSALLEAQTAFRRLRVDVDRLR